MEKSIAFIIRKYYIYVFNLLFSVFLNVLLNLIPFHVKTEQILCFGKKKSVCMLLSTLAFCR